MGVLLAATLAVTSPAAYAAPFDTGNGLIPLGEPTHPVPPPSPSLLSSWPPCPPFKFVKSTDRDHCQLEAAVLRSHGVFVHPKMH